eukprot:6955311-Alexandrium_andersonii.AAC.1
MPGPAHVTCCGICFDALPVYLGVWQLPAPLHSHTHMHKYTHMHTNAHAQAHTHTHAHAQTDRHDWTRQDMPARTQGQDRTGQDWTGQGRAGP